MNSGYLHILKELNKFNRERCLEKFHSPRNLATALTVESSELLEIFQWKLDNSYDIIRVKEELADIFIYGILLAQKTNIDINNAILEKINRNIKENRGGKLCL